MADGKNPKTQIVASWKAEEDELGQLEIFEDEIRDDDDGVQDLESLLMGPPYIPRCLCDAEGKTSIGEPGEICTRCNGESHYPWMSREEAIKVAAERGVDRLEFE